VTGEHQRPVTYNEHTRTGQLAATRTQASRIVVPHPVIAARNVMPISLTTASERLIEHLRWFIGTLSGPGTRSDKAYRSRVTRQGDLPM
jgi:hypothetical protein